MMSIPHNRLVLVMAILMIVSATACKDDGTPVDAETSVPPPGPAMGEHVWTTADGNRMPYTVAGNSDADVTILFVHCWMCDRSFWEAQLPALAGQYRTVTLDLPGHGEATAERTQWRVSAYGDDVAGLVDALELSQVVLVGHSMGGPVSLRAAALLSGKVLGIVAVDTLHDAEFEFDSEEVQGFMRAFEEDFVGTCNRFVEQMFPEEGVDEVVAHVRSTGCDANRSEAGIALMRDFGTIDMPAWFREAGVPIRAINKAEPNQTRIEVNRKYADYDAVLMEGVGHYPHMTRPDEFNKLLIEAIAGLVG
jgi:pimeloyl-ACP methyl ester carboxylesterase